MIICNKEEALDLIKKDYNQFICFSEELKKDADILLEASKSSCSNIYVSKDDYDNYDFFKELINSAEVGYILVKASDRLRKNKVLNKMLVTKNIEYFKYMPIELKNDVNYVSNIISKIGNINWKDILNIYPYLGDKIINDKNKIIKLYNAQCAYKDNDKFLSLRLIKIPILKYVGEKVLGDRKFLHEFLELPDEDIDYVISNLNQMIITEDTCSIMHLPSDM